MTVLLAVTVLLAKAKPLSAADLATEFLEGLRRRGWHDVAMEYLDQAKDDPIAGSEFLDRIDFERATTEVALARAAIQKKRRQALIKQATARFQEFANSHRESPFYLEALAQAGELLNEQALISLSNADRLPNQADDEKKRLRIAARKLFSSATQVLETLLKDCESRIAALPKAAQLQRDAEARTTSRKLRDTQAKGKLRLASIGFETSRTFPENSAEYSKTLAEAGKVFRKLSEDYEGTRAGYFCILFEGRCKQAAGDFKAALESYDYVIDQPSPDPNLRRLMARAYRRRAECFLATDEFDQAIEECRDWLNEARADERRQTYWLAVAYRLADAYQAKSKALSDRSKVNRLQSDARKLYREIARVPGEFQNLAKAALATAGGKIEPVATNSFGEALAAGKEALGQMNSSSLAARLAEENNPEAVEDLRAQADLSKKAAQEYFEKSLRLVDEETPLEELLTVRYYLCWLYWQDERLHESAVIGDYLARRYSDSKFAPGAARLALAAYERLFNEAKLNEAKRSGSADANNRRFESQRLVAIAQLIIERWPDSDDAGMAMNLLINIALGEGRLDKAEQLLVQLPEDRRAAAQLSLGGSMWTRYLQLTAGDSTSPSEEVSAWKDRASKLLSDGFEQLRQHDGVSRRPSSAEATAILYLVQLLLAEGESDRAVQVLEDSKVGPLSLVTGEAAVQHRPEFARETYKAALRAYVSADPPRRDQALQMMESLESTVGNKKDAQRQLTNIYVSLGLQLQRQISELSAAGKAAKASAVAASFEDLLKRVTEQNSERGGENDWKIRLWIAQTNLQLGSGLRGKDASRYLGQAEKIYREILAEVKKDAEFAPNQIAVLGVKKRLGDCLQSQQKFEEAFEQYTLILKKKPNMLELQQATATALQSWGAEKGNLEKLEQAILGAMPQKNGKNLVWGWLRLAKIVDHEYQKAKRATANEKKTAKYRDFFFEARYNAAKARFEVARTTGGTAGEKYRQTAKRSVESMKRLYPGLGGPKWQQAFDDLLQQINAQSKN
ncbi:MAG: hypothetical protein GXP28_11445 [Planctomycetes bacterium]|nr:hypothetical protein [Planctomycetota bacterium]